MIAPELTTERLLLRGPRLADFPDSVAMWTDPVTTRYIGGGVQQTREQTYARVLRHAGHWALLGYGIFTVVERATGTFAGEVGIASFERDITPPLIPFEAAWVLAPWCHGRGYATEALRAVHTWFEGAFPHQPTQCIIDVGNVPSHRVAERLGYTEIDRRTYHGAPLIVFQR